MFPGANFFNKKLVSRILYLFDKYSEFDVERANDQIANQCGLLDSIAKQTITRNFTNRTGDIKKCE